MRASTSNQTEAVAHETAGLPAQSSTTGAPLGSGVSAPLPVPYSQADGQAVAIVLAANHPSPENGGPCWTCAFRPGTEASTTEHTRELARLCVEGLRAFHCHERPQLCRGFVAAVNLRGVPETEDDRRYAEACGVAADLLGELIGRAAEADRVNDMEEA